MVFLSYSGFHTHVNRFHAISNASKRSNLCVTSAKCNFFACTLENCSFKTNSLKDFKKHYYLHLSEGQSFICPLNCGSETIFTKKNTLRVHFCRKHSNNILECNTLDQISEEKQKDFLVGTNNSDQILGTEDITQNNWQSSGLNLFSNLYLTLESKYLLSKASIQFLISGISDIGKLNSAYICSILKQKGFDISPDVIEKDLFYLANNISEGIFKSIFLKEEFFKKKFNYVKPVKVTLQNNINQSFYYYIPILDTIQQLCKNKYVLEQILVDVTPNKSFFSDLTDGCSYKNNVLFKTNNFALKIILYQDAFEICNPLGSAKKKYKIIGVYMVLANLQPWLRMKIDHIQLVSLFFEKDQKNFGFNVLLKPLISDLKLLENDGIMIQGNNIKGSLVAVVGDNLGSHQLGGFSENFRTNTFFCRYCYESDFDTNLIDGSNIQYRDNISHKSDTYIAEATNETYKGVKAKSILNDLTYFQVCNPGLPPCIAHDIFEGVAQYDLMLIASKMLHDKKMSFEFFNSKIHKLKFVDKSDNINLPEIKKSFKLTGNATQILHLLYILPFAFLDSIGELQENECWQLLLILREITKLVMGFKLSVDQLAILQNHLHEYIYLRKKIFPTVPLKPKHHYILHYPYLIKQFGPLRHLWSLRFESKHGYFKKIIGHCRNFKNVLSLLTNKHQLLQTLEILQNESYSSFVVCKDANIFIESDFPDYLSNVIKRKKSFKENPFYISTSVIFKGVGYSEGMNICVGKNIYGLYQILNINFILINKQFTDIDFVGKSFFVFFNAYSGLLEETHQHLNQDVMCFNYNELINVEPLLHYCDSAKNIHMYYFKSAPYEHF